MEEIQNLENMNEFWNSRATTYDEHMKNNINKFKKFYKMIARPITETNDKIKISRYRLWNWVRVKIYI